MRHTKLFIIILALFFVTGCENKTLDCSKITKIESGIATEHQKISFTNNQINEYNAEMEFKINNEFQDYKDILLKDFENSFSNLKNKKGIEYKATINDNNIIITIQANYSKMNNEAKKILNLSNKISYTESLKALENDGYNCKH